MSESRNFWSNRIRFIQGGDSTYSCLAYGKLGMTAVILRAEAVLQAWIMMRSSIRPSLMSPGAVDCRMKTAENRCFSSRPTRKLGIPRVDATIPSSSRILSPIVTLVS